MFGVLFGCVSAIESPDQDKAQRAPRAVVVALDNAFLSEFHRDPSDRAAMRSVFALMQRRMNDAAPEHRAASIAWSIRFVSAGPLDGGTAALAQALRASPIPVSLALDSMSPLDPEIAAAAYGVGHVVAIRDLASILWWNRHKGAWGIPLHQALPMIGAVQTTHRPLSVVALDSLLGANGGAPGGIVGAEEVARDAAVTFTTSRNWLCFGCVTGTTLAMPIQGGADPEIVSAFDVLRSDAARDSLEGAVVFVGVTYTRRAPNPDLHDFRRDGALVPGVYAHAWAAQDLLERAGLSTRVSEWGDEVLPTDPAFEADPTTLDEATVETAFADCQTEDPDACEQLIDAGDES